MNPCKQFALLVLLAITCLIPVSASAQDVATVVVDKGTYNGWIMTIRDNNSPGHLPINHVGLKIMSPGVIFVGASDPANWSDDISNSSDSISWNATGGSITFPNSLAGFAFYLDGFSYGQPVQLQWTTLNNASVVTTGTFSLIPTEFQYLARFDSVVTKLALLGPDPCFTYKIYNFNSGNFAIKEASFQLLNTGGTVRPSEIQAPAGWVIDSLTPSTAYFHSTGSSSDLETGKNLDGFRVCLRASPNVSSYNFVWTVRTDNGALIDRDTLRNLNITPGSQTFTSNDTVLANKTAGCLYGFTVENYHATNPTPPSPLDKIVFTSTTPGVTFQSAPTGPQNWGKAINGPGNTLTFQASTSADALQSGNTSSFFQANMNNPAGGAFVIHWETSYGGAALSSGDLNLTCTEATSSKDTATIAANGSCCYKLTVTNQHNPPSNVYAISIAIPKNQGQFQTTAGTVASSLSWNVSQVDVQSIRFTAQTGFQGSSASQDLNFCITPPASNAAVPITWTTYDQAGATISTGTANATNCILSTGKCDSVTIAPISQQDCNYGIVIGNRRGTGSPVTTVTVTPLDGWKINTHDVAAGWTTTADPNGSSVRFSSSSGISEGVQFGYQVGFIGYNTSSNFRVEIRSADDNSNICLDTINLTCTPTQIHDGVAPDGQSALALSVAPNPFTSQSDLTFELPARSNVSVTLVDILGRTQQTILNSPLDAGHHSLRIDGSTLTPGTYYLRFETLYAKLTKKLVITR